MKGPMQLAGHRKVALVHVKGWNEQQVDLITLGISTNLFLAVYLHSDHETLR